MKAETVGYSSQLATMYLENMHLLSSFCKDMYQLTASEYELMLTLLKSQCSLQIQQLADFLVLKPSTLWQMALSLEDRGFVIKYCDESDKRLLGLSLSDKGRLLINECSKGLSKLHARIIYDALPHQEHSQHLHKTIGASLDTLRGHSSAITLVETSPTEFRVEFMIFMRVIIEQWKQCIRNHAELSFSEFRILHTLDEHSAMRIQDISQHLMIAPSQVSAGKRRLEIKEYILEKKNPLDGRSVLLTATAKGLTLVEEVTKHLDRITVPTHSPGTEEAVMVLRAWHTRMYYNLRKHYGQNT